MLISKFYTLVAEQVRLNAADPTEQERIVTWGNLCSVRMATDWYWRDLSHAISITFAEGQRVYPFSAITTDIDGNAIVVGKEKKDSFVDSGRSMVYRPHQWLDDRDPGWRDSSNTGPSQIFTFERRQLVLERVPDAAFIAGTPKIYGRVSVRTADITVDAAATALENLTPGWPVHLQECLIKGTEVWGFERQGAADWVDKKRDWIDMVDEAQASDSDEDSDYEATQDLPTSMQGFGGR